jgi:hypothetical protein
MIAYGTRQTRICERLKQLGYCRHQRMRMYGEDFDLLSDPIPHETGYAIEVVCRRSGTVKQLPIPLPTLEMIRQEVA